MSFSYPRSLIKSSGNAASAPCALSHVYFQIDMYLVFALIKEQKKKKKRINADMTALLA